MKKSRSKCGINLKREENVFMISQYFTECRDWTQQLYEVRNSPLKYLVGTVDRWNNAKRAELKDRVKHGMFDGDEAYDGKQ